MLLFWILISRQINSVSIDLKEITKYSPGCPGTHFVDQAGLELRNPPASASQVLGLKAPATTAGLPLLSRGDGGKEKQTDTFTL